MTRKQILHERYMMYLSNSDSGNARYSYRYTGLSKIGIKVLIQRTYVNEPEISRIPRSIMNNRE